VIGGFSVRIVTQGITLKQAMTAHVRKLLVLMIAFRAGTYRRWAA